MIAGVGDGQDIAAGQWLLDLEAPLEVLRSFEVIGRRIVVGRRKRNLAERRLNLRESVARLESGCERVVRRYSGERGTGGIGRQVHVAKGHRRREYARRILIDVVGDADREKVREESDATANYGLFAAGAQRRPGESEARLRNHSFQAVI